MIWVTNRPPSLTLAVEVVEQTVTITPSAVDPDGEVIDITLYWGGREGMAARSRQGCAGDITSIRRTAASGSSWPPPPMMKAPALPCSSMWRSYRMRKRPPLGGTPPARATRNGTQRHDGRSRTRYSSLDERRLLAKRGAGAVVHAIAGRHHRRIESAHLPEHGVDPARRDPHGGRVGVDGHSRPGWSPPPSKRRAAWPG